MTKQERAAYSAARREVIKQQTALQKAGIKTRGDVRKTFPTLKEIDKAGKKSVKGLTTKAQKWVSAPSHQIPTAKKQPELLVKSVDAKAEARKEAHRKAQAAYRQRTKERIAALSQSERNLLKAAKKFGIKGITAKNVSVFAEYLEYRKDITADSTYGSSQVESALDEYSEMMKDKSSNRADEIFEDFKMYMSDRVHENVQGYDYATVSRWVEEYMK